MSKAGNAIYEGLVEPEYVALENYDRVEEEGVSSQFMGRWTIWFLVVTAAIIIASYYYAVVKLTGQKDELALESSYPEKAVMAQEVKEKLGQYGYNAGNYQIPIDKAMQLVATEKGKNLPVQSAPDSTAVPAP